MMHPDLSSKLLTAVRGENLDSLRSIIQLYRGEPMYVKTDFGEALCLAAKCGAEAIVQELLRCKASVLYADDQGRRPIHHACLGPSVQVLKMLLSSGSVTSCHDENGYTPLHYATEKQNSQMVAMLLSKNPTVTRAKSYKNNETALHIAGTMGNSEIVRMILKETSDGSTLSLDKYTPLMYAIKHNHMLAVTVFCEGGVNLEKMNATGQTALHMSGTSTPSIMSILLEHGALPCSEDHKGHTPLHVVALQPKGDFSIRQAQLLLNNGAIVNHSDKSGYLPLHCALMSGNSPVAKLLLKNGADVNSATNVTMDSPLLLAVALGRTDMIEELVEAGAEVNCSDQGDVTPLHKLQGARISLDMKNKFTDYLIRHGAKINRPIQRGYTPLDRCVFHSVLGSFSVEALLRIVQAGAHLKPGPGPKSNIQHNSPLCWLTWHGNLPVARFLVNAGWDLRREHWIRLPARNEETLEFLAYIWSLVKTPRTLRILCRTVIREHFNKVTLDTDIVPYVDATPLPTFLKRFINLEMEIEACKEEIKERPPQIVL